MYIVIYISGDGGLPGQPEQDGLKEASEQIYKINLFMKVNWPILPPWPTRTNQNEGTSSSKGRQMVILLIFFHASLLIVVNYSI